MHKGEEEKGGGGKRGAGLCQGLLHATYRASDMHGFGDHSIQHNARL